MYKMVSLDEVTYSSRYMKRRCDAFNAEHRYSIKVYNYTNIFKKRMVCVCVLDYYHGVIKSYHFSKKDEIKTVIKFDKVFTKARLFVKKRCK